MVAHHQQARQGLIISQGRGGQVSQVGNPPGAVNIGIDPFAGDPQRGRG